jgi:hypothetical protein
MAQLSTTVPVEQRVAVVEGLLLSPLSVSLPLLLKAAKDPSVLVRTQAVEIAAQLPMIDGKPAGQPVLRLLSDDGNAVIRTRAAALLLRLLHVPQRSAQLAIPSVRASVEKVSKPGSVPAVVPAPLPATLDVGGTGADPLKSSPIAELARRGRRALETSDFAAAELLIGKAKKVCQRSAKTPGCAELSFELSFLLGRAHEAQGHTAEAMTEFERAMKLSPKVPEKQRKSRRPKRRCCAWFPSSAW